MNMKFARIFLATAFTAFPTLCLAAQLLVLSKSDATLAFVDPASGKTSATVPTGDGPHEVEVSTDGRLAFVSNYGARVPGNTLSVVDIATRKELKRVDLGELRRPHGLTFANGYLYLTSEESRRIGRYDPGAQRIDWTFDVGQDGTHMVLASREGTKLFASNMGSNSISILEQNASGEWAQRLVTVGAGPEGLDLSADGRALWTAHSRDGGISVIDIANAKVIHTLDAKTKRSNRLKFTPDGRLVLVSDLTAGELAIFDALSRTERARLKLGRTPTGILVAPGGEQAFVAVSGEHHIAVIDLKALSVSRTIATGKDPDGMAWVR
jgi:DNA-binding beta-propeller fold protein YncE